MHKSFQRVVVAALAGPILVTGCTKTRVATVGRLEESQTEIQRPVPYTGTYVAKWSDSDSNHLHSIPGSTRFAHAGEKLGFARADGQLLAFHDEARVPLKAVPAKAKYVVWYNKKTVQTQFGREVDKAMDGTTKTLAVVFTGAIIVGVVAWIGYEAVEHPESFFSSDDCNH